MSRIADIRARWEAASPAPWFWRGNVDHEDPSLACRRPHVPGKSLGGTTEVLSHVRHQLNRDDAVRAGLLEVEIDLSTRVDGQWRPWSPTVDGILITEDHPHYDRLYQEEVAQRREALIEEWLTDEYGEPKTERRLSFTTRDGVPWLVEARTLAEFQVCPEATSRDDPRVYRADIVGVRHPDAIAIEHSAADVAYLLQRLDTAERCIASLSASAASTGTAHLRAEISSFISAYHIRTKEPS